MWLFGGVRGASWSCLMAFEAIALDGPFNSQAPSYISELISLKSNAHSHNLRSSNDKCQLLRQRWRWVIVPFLVQHLYKIWITDLFRLGNPHQLFHLRLSWNPTCLCKFVLTLSVNYLIAHYLVNDLALSKHGVLFKKGSSVYLHSYCAIFPLTVIQTTQKHIALHARIYLITD